MPIHLTPRPKPPAVDESLERSQAARADLARRQRLTEERLNTMIREHAREQRAQQWSGDERRFHERRTAKKR